MNFQSKWNTFVEHFLEKEGWRDVVTGLENTLKIAVIGLIIGIVLGTLLAAVRVMPKYSRTARVLDRIAGVYIAAFRGTPIVVQLLLGYFVLMPLIGLGRVPAETACIFFFGLNSAAYVSEIMRGGLNSVDGGQMEAGRALGLSYGTTMLRIVIPQAVKNIIPTLGNELITLLKETSVIGLVGAMDFSKAFTKLGDNSYEPMVPYIVMAICYVLIILLVSLLIRSVERLLAKSDRTAPANTKKSKVGGVG